MIKKYYKGKIPFDPNGNLYAYAPYSYQEVEWKDNYQFQEIVKITGYSRGRSSAVINVKGAAKYQIFMSDFDEVIKNCNIYRGEIMIYNKFMNLDKPTWTFVKKGSNYGLALVMEEKL